MMDRRTFISSVTLTVLAAPLTAEAQETKVYRVGVLAQGSPPPPGGKPGPFGMALHNLGYSFPPRLA
jgi:hypothetical protein